MPAPKKLLDAVSAAPPPSCSRVAHGRRRRAAWGRLRESRGLDWPWTRVFYLNGWRGRRTLPFNMYSKGALRGSQQITPGPGEPPHPTPHFAGHQRVPHPFGRPWQFSSPGGPKTNHRASQLFSRLEGESACLPLRPGARRESGPRAAIP